MYAYCLCVCTRLCLPMCGCWRLKLGTFFNYSPLYFETGFLLELEACQFGYTTWPASFSKLQQAPESSSKLPASLPCSTGVTEVLPAPGFYVGAGDRNSGPSVCMVSTDQLSHLPSSLNKAQKNGNIFKEMSK